MELDPAIQVRIIEELSRADGSAGWTVLIGNSTAFFAWLDPQVAEAMIGEKTDFVCTSMWGPLGRAVADGPGTYRISGRWPFNSGCSHAEWLQVGVLVSDRDGSETNRRPGGELDWRFAFVPRQLATIEDDWDAAGLRGTGSHHLSIAGERIPMEHLAAPFFEAAREDGPLWKIPFITLAGMLMAGFPLGVARRAVDEFTELAKGKTRGAEPATVALDGHAQVQLAVAEAGLEAARALVFDAISRVWATACRGETPCLDDRARVLLAANQAMRAGVQAVDSLFRLAGASAVLLDQPLQRCFRDLHAANQHILFSAGRDQAFAKLRLGIEQSTFLI
jgi:alkylation response protein AidB-like acyl-CoA dehydrogenase